MPTSSSLGIVVKDGTHLTCKMSNRSMLDFMMWLQKNRSGLMQDADGTLLNHTTIFNHAIITIKEIIVVAFITLTELGIDYKPIKCFPFRGI